MAKEIRASSAADRVPRCILIAGPNGAGKTTFAREFLPHYAEVGAFVNADLIAEGLSPFQPRTAAIRAGRLLLDEIDRLASRRADFALESTLSGVTLLSRWKRWKKAGYRIEVIYLTLPSAEIAVRRVAQRVRQGGHSIPSEDVHPDSRGVGAIFVNSISRWPMRGWCTIIPGTLPA